MKSLGRIFTLLMAVAVMAAACSRNSTPAQPDKSPESSMEMHPSPSMLTASGQWNPKPDQPFADPPQIYSKNGNIDVSLVEEPKIVQVAGSPLKVNTINGYFGGPTLHVNPGDTMTLTLVNHLDQPTNYHFHGFHVSPTGNSDNVFRYVAPGATAHYTLKLPSDHDQGLFWYHSHMHTISEGQVFSGLSGAIVIGDIAKYLPSDFQGITQRQFLLRDVQTDGGAILSTDGQINPSKPTTRLVNGLYRPQVQIAPGETQLWRFANIGADIFYDVAMKGVTFHVIAEDGSPVWNIWSTKDLVMPPGKRFEVLVQGPPAGTYPLQDKYYEQGFMNLPAQMLAMVKSTGSPVQPPLAIPATINPKAGDQDSPLNDVPIAQHRTMVFSIVQHGNQTLFEINGQTFDPNRVDVQPKVGTTEEWTLKNTSDEQHPFHIHVNDFQVMSVNGKPYEANGLQDTVIIPAHGQVVIRIPFIDYTGEFVFHCHILGHEDGGMMQTVDVVK